MPAKDTYHDAVKNALIKDGWSILADPLLLIVVDMEREEILQWIN